MLDNAIRLLLLILLTVTVFAQGTRLECEDHTFYSLTVDLGHVHIIQKVAIIAPFSVYYIQTEISREQTTKTQLKSLNNSPLVVYSSLDYSSAEHVTLNTLARKLYFVPVYSKKLPPSPVVLLTVCRYDSPINYFNENSYTVDTREVGLVSSFDNQLDIIFRTYENGIFIFSMHDEGDLLVVQIVDGIIYVIYDFGTLSHSSLSGGIALNDGEWHEVRWIYNYDKVELIIDGALVNSTDPLGYAKRLDLDDKIHIAGRPPDNENSPIELSFHGCLARVELNKVNLLAKVPTEMLNDCQMPKPQLMTVYPGAFAEIRYTFLPFQIEFRILQQPATLLILKDTRNHPLVQISLNENGFLVLNADSVPHEQQSNQEINVADGSWHSLSIMIRSNSFYVDVDLFRALWIEGSVVRHINHELALFHIAAVGCYRSATIDFSSANTLGNVPRDKCAFITRCTPNPCKNGGRCEQTSLTEFQCICTKNYYGKLCHASRLRHSCEEYFTDDVRRDFSNVTLDLDGGHSLESFFAQCKRRVNNHIEEITTSLHHDLDASGAFISGTTEPGNIRKKLNYKLHLLTLDRFVDGFENCKQYMRFECMGGTKLMMYGNEKRPSSWYSIRNGQHGLQWGDAPPFSGMCSCALNSSATCLRNGLCNCDSGENAVDEGYNTHALLLPIMSLYLGGTSPTSSLNVSIGPLICWNRVVDIPLAFHNRDASLSGEMFFSGVVFDISLIVRFLHSQMTIFTWESENQQRWFLLYVMDGHIIGQLMNGGTTFEITFPKQLNDSRWHFIYWEVNQQGMLLSVDGKEVQEERPLIIPQLTRWIIGSRTGSGLSGFAGSIKSVHLCGKELLLKQYLQKQSDVKGTTIGDTGACEPNICLNGGKCDDYYDTFKCNCSALPFGGDKCEQDIGMAVHNGTELSILWQHPDHTAPCFRIAVTSKSVAYSLIRAKAHFSDAELNLTVNSAGALEVSAYDGISIYFKQSNPHLKLNQQQVADIEFCGTMKGFKLTVNGEKAITSSSNWSFLDSLNVWKFLDSGFSGCVMRMQIGKGFPLKDPHATRLIYRGRIHQGSCPFDQQYQETKLPANEEIYDSGIRIVTMHSSTTLVGILTPVIGVIASSAVFLLVLVIVCWIRNRPDGVYKTNENIHAYCSPSRSEEPLVAKTNANATTNSNIINNNNSNNINLYKEYFC